MRLSVISVFLIGVSLYQVDCLNILGVFPYEGKSHFFVFKPLLLELANRGHNLTVISHFPQEKPPENYHDISLAGKSEVLEAVFPIESTYWTVLQIGIFLWHFGTENCKLLLSDENVQKLWKSNAKYDVVLTEQFQSDCALGLAHQLGAPAVGLTSHLQMPWHYDRIGIQYNPSYMSFMMTGGGSKPTFLQRLERSFFNTYFNVIYKYFMQATDQKTLAQYFDNVPPLQSLAQDMKMLLLYQSPALVGSSTLTSNIKEVAGYHVAKPRELPDDLKKFIDEAEHGVIYISFGSMLKANTTPKDKLEAIVGAISELPHRVVWKWDDTDMFAHNKNIYVSTWLPQNDILAHPKVLAFYSHCGLLGTTEALHYGVPIVGMPSFGDQPGNAALVEESGLGVQIQVGDLTKELLLEKLRTVLDPKFRAKVKELSKFFHDRPMSAMDSAVYWTEFAARHKDRIVKPPVLDVPLYQYFGLDVLATYLLALIVLITLIRHVCNKTCSRKKGYKGYKKD